MELPLNEKQLAAIRQGSDAAMEQHWLEIFAGQALMGMLARPGSTPPYTADHKRRGITPKTPSHYAASAFEFARAMVAERDRRAH